MFRLSLPTAAVVAALLTATPAAALAPQAAPTSETTTLPGSSRVVDDWKLVGRGSATAVQIAPRWVLSTDHASMPPGFTFTNGYGSATVDRQVRPPCGYGNDCGGADLTLHLLTSPIDAPAYPRLLGEAVASSRSIPGVILSAGFGGVGTGNTPGVAWSTPSGMAVPPMTGNVEVIGGDSGGAMFWYPSADASPVLTNVLSSLGSPVMGSFQQDLADDYAGPGLTARSWLEREFAKVATPAPVFTSLAGAQLPPVTSPPLPVSGTRLSRPGASCVTVAWTNPEGGSPRSGFRILANGSEVATPGPSATSARICWLAWLTDYTVRVIATNAVGDAAPAAGDQVSFRTRWLF